MIQLYITLRKHDEILANQNIFALYKNAEQKYNNYAAKT